MESSEPRVPLTLTLSAEAKEALAQMAEQSHLTYGEVLDRILTKHRPRTSALAAKAAIDEICILFSELSSRECDIAYLDLLVAMVAVLNPDEMMMMELLGASKERRQKVASQLAEALTEKKRRLKSPSGGLN